MKFKRGAIFECITNGKRIKLVNKNGGNKHWNCNQLDGGNQSHHIHEGTIKKYYRQVK